MAKSLKTFVGFSRRSQFFYIKQSRNQPIMKSIKSLILFVFLTSVVAEGADKTTCEIDEGKCLLTIETSTGSLAIDLLPFTSPITSQSSYDGRLAFKIDEICDLFCFAPLPHCFFMPPVINYMLLYSMLLC